MVKQWFYWFILVHFKNHVTPGLMNLINCPFVKTSKTVKQCFRAAESMVGTPVLSERSLVDTFGTPYGRVCYVRHARQGGGGYRVVVGYLG